MSRQCKGADTSAGRQRRWGGQAGQQGHRDAMSWLSALAPHAPPVHCKHQAALGSTRQHCTLLGSTARCWAALHTVHYHSPCTSWILLESSLNTNRSTPCTAGTAQHSTAQHSTAGMCGRRCSGWLVGWPAGQVGVAGPSRAGLGHRAARGAGRQRAARLLLLPHCATAAPHTAAPPLLPPHTHSY